MEKNIDWYINNILYGENISKSATSAYTFDDDGVILTGYHFSREETIKALGPIINELNANGVLTPRYLGYKKDEYNCFLLQEKAKGDVYSKYTTEHLIEEASKIPAEHYAKFISDVLTMKANGLALELRPRNFFYDPQVGFTIIDIGMGTRDAIDTSYASMYFDFKHILSGLNINIVEGLDIDEWNKQQLFNAKRLSKILTAFEMVIPAFKEEKRWYLRNFSTEELEALENVGYKVGNLALTSEEQTQFGNFVATAARQEIEDIKAGKDTFGQKNKTRIYNLLNDSCKYFEGYKYRDTNEHFDDVFFEQLTAEYDQNRTSGLLKEAVVSTMSKRIAAAATFAVIPLQEFVRGKLNDCEKNNTLPNYDGIMVEGLTVLDEMLGRSTSNTEKKEL